MILNFLHELKRRNIYKAATVYVVAGWVLLQVSDTVLPAFGFTDQSFRVLTIALLLGFPLALIIAWFFEITEDGIKRTMPSGSDFVASAPMTDYVVIGLLLIVVFLTSWEQFSASPAGTELATSQSSAQLPVLSNVLNSGQRVTRSTLSLGNPDIKTQSRTRSYMVLSNDGRQLAYSFRKDGIERLMIRDLSRLEPRVLWEMEVPALTALDFSPDDSRIVFTAGRDIYVVDVASGIADIVYTATDGSFAALWINNEEFSIPGERGSAVLRINATTGAVEDFFQHADPSVLVNRTRIIPERNAALLTVALGGGRYRIDVLDLETNESKILIEDAIRPDYTASGHLVFLSAGSLWAAPFDLENLEITGLEKLVVSNIESTTSYQLAAYSFSDQGRMVYIPNDGRALSLAVPEFVSFDGAEFSIDLPPNRYKHPMLSPDGTKLAIKEGDGSSTGTLWLYDMVTGVYEQRTFNERLVIFNWSHDSENLYFAITREDGDTDSSEVYSMQNSGLGERRLLLRQEGGIVFPRASTPGEESLLVDFLVNQRDWSIGQIAINQAGSPLQKLMDTDFSPSVSLSPSGNYIAYMLKTETGLDQSFIRPFPDLEVGLWSLPPNSAEPRWSLDGHSLFYVDQINSRLMMMPVSAEPPFFQGRPEVVAEDIFYNEFQRPTYSVGADNNSVVVLKRIEDDELYSNTSAVLVDNWFTELSQLVPNIVQ